MEVLRPFTPVGIRMISSLDRFLFFLCQQSFEFFALEDLKDRPSTVFGRIGWDLLPCPENAEEIIRGRLRNAKAALSRIIPRPNARAG
jgi:hypothetical protein